MVKGNPSHPPLEALIEEIQRLKHPSAEPYAGLAWPCGGREAPKRSQPRKTGLSPSLLLMLGFSQWPEEKSGRDFWSYFASLPLHTVLFFCVQVSLQGQNWNLHLPPACTSACTAPLEGRMRETRGCGHFGLSLAGPGWVQTPQVPRALAAGDTMTVNSCPHFSGATPGFKSPVCESQRYTLRCYFVLEFRNNITEYIIALCMLHWKGGISQSSPLKLQPPWGTCCVEERDWVVGAADLGSEYFCHVTWCGKKKETPCHDLTWGMCLLSPFLPFSSHHSPHRILWGGIPKHLIYPESVLWYLHKGIWKGCKTSDHCFSMSGTKFLTYPRCGEVYPCGISKMQFKMMFPILPLPHYSQIYQLNHPRGSYGAFQAAKHWVCL